MKITDKKELMKLASFIIMGDAGVYYPKNGKNAYFAMNMIQKNEDYIDFCKDVISNITNVNKREVIKDVSRQNQYNISSKTHPFFSKLRERIYNEDTRYKGLDWHAMKLLDFQALAILFMSDGSAQKYLRPDIGMVNYSYRVTLNMKRLSYGDTVLLKKVLKDKLDLEFNVNKQKKPRGGYYYYLALRVKDAKKMMDGIRPFVFESFQYKVLNVELPS